MEKFKAERPVSKSQSELVDKIKGEIKNKNYKAVSVKFSDTLVVIPFSELYDIFILMQKEFSGIYSGKKSFPELRVKAQEEAEKKYFKTGNVTIEKIYEILGKIAKISPEDCAGLIRRECELVEKFSFPRSFGTEIFQTARKNKKKIIITADTIYSRNVIVRILSKCGFETCNELIIQSETGIADADKSALFDFIVKTAKFPENKILHIGGNVADDVETPILKGAKSLLISPVVPLMVKSGRLRGFVQSRHIYDYDEPEYLALHRVFGLYALYGFDIPQNKIYQSDFCNDAYMIGFIVLGALSLDEKYIPEKGVAESVYNALNENPESAAGLEDFRNMYSGYFGEEKTEVSGCSLPFEFLVSYAAAGDRALFQNYMNEKDFRKWTESISEPDTAPVHARQIKQNAASRLADKMFPPGTKVRNIVDGMLIKMKSGK